MGCFQSAVLYSLSWVSLTKKSVTVFIRRYIALFPNSDLNYIMSSTSGWPYVSWWEDQVLIGKVDVYSKKGVKKAKLRWQKELETLIHVVCYGQTLSSQIAHVGRWTRSKVWGHYERVKDDPFAGIGLLLINLKQLIVWNEELAICYPLSMGTRFNIE